jgi:hypothetical protein
MTRLCRTWALKGAMAGIFLLSGCATVITGTRQDIEVESQPAGAVCTFTRAGETLGSVTTPGSLRVKRDAAPMTVVCTRADYEEARAVMHARTETAAMVASGIIGGSIATHIDRGSGAANRYETALRVELTPLSAADRAAVAAARTAAAAPASAAAPAAPAPPPVLRGRWRARTVLIADRSVTTCSSGGVDYALDVSGDVLTVENASGRVLVTTLPADGKVDQTFRSLNGAQLAIVGNARTRALEIASSTPSCSWTLTPLT